MKPAFVGNPYLTDSEPPVWTEQEGWEISPQPSEPPRSLHVFGPSGGAYSVIVMRKTTIPGSMTSMDGEWVLHRGNAGSTEASRFTLESVVDVPGGDFVALRGREIPLFRTLPA